MKSPRVSIEVAKHILDTRPEKYINQKLPWLKKACRCIMAMEINDMKYLMICGQPYRHRGIHEDIDGGVYWRRK